MRGAVDLQVSWREERAKIVACLATIRDLSHGGYRTGRCIRAIERELKGLGAAFVAEAETGGP